MDPRYCPMCGKTLAEKARPDAVYCQPSCRSKAFRRSKRAEKRPAHGPPVAETLPTSGRARRAAPANAPLPQRRVAMEHQLTTQAPVGAVGYRLLMPPLRPGDRPSLSPRKRLGEDRPFWALQPLHLPDDTRLQNGNLYRILWVGADGKSVAAKPGGGLPTLHYFLGAPDSPADSLDDELQALLAQTSADPEFKRIHAALLQQRAARLQQKILAEQAAEQAAQDQKLLEEVKQQAAEMRRKTEKAQKSFAKAMRKQRKREAKEAKQRGVDWSEWLPLFKMVTSSLRELAELYLKLRPKLAQMKKEGKDSGLKVFLLLAFLQAMQKHVHPEPNSATESGQPAPAEPASSATASNPTAAPQPAPASGPARPSTEHSSGDPAAVPPTSTPDSEPSAPAFHCDAFPGFCKLLREMGVFARAVDSPETSKETADTGIQCEPSASPAESAQDSAERGLAEQTPAPSLADRMSEMHPEVIIPVSQAVLHREYVESASLFTESAEEDIPEPPVSTAAERSEPLLGVHWGDAPVARNGSPAEGGQDELIAPRIAGHIVGERMAQARGTRDRQRLATAAESSRLRRAQAGSWSVRQVRPVALITIAVLLGLLLGAGAARDAARQNGSHVALLEKQEQRFPAEVSKDMSTSNRFLRRLSHVEALRGRRAHGPKGRNVRDPAACLARAVPASPSGRELCLEKFRVSVMNPARNPAPMVCRQNVHRSRIVELPVKMVFGSQIKQRNAGATRAQVVPQAL